MADFLPPQGRMHLETRLSLPGRLAKLTGKKSKIRRQYYNSNLHRIAFLELMFLLFWHE
jgi:hypothetical protein